MPTPRSGNYNRTVNAVNASEAPLFLVEITHPDLPEPVRVVNNTEDITHQGNIFTACAFSLSLPSQEEQREPSVNIRIDNVGRVLTDYIEQTRGGINTEWRFIQIMPSDPDTIEWETVVQSKNVSMSRTAVSVSLGYAKLIALEGMPTVYTPRTAPGLF